MAASRSLIRCSGISEISRSFKDAVSSNFVAASISFAVFWHKFKCVMDVAKRLTATSCIAMQQSKTVAEVAVRDRPNKKAALSNAVGSHLSSFNHALTDALRGAMAQMCFDIIYSIYETCQHRRPTNPQNPPRNNIDRQHTTGREATHVDMGALTSPGDPRLVSYSWRGKLNGGIRIASRGYPTLAFGLLIETWYEAVRVETQC